MTKSFNPDKQNIAKLRQCVDSIDWKALNKKLDNQVNDAKKTLQRDDWIWYALINSLATLQGSPADDFDWDAYRRECAWAVVENLPQSEASKLLDSLFRRYKLRYAAIKAGWAAKNIQIIKANGGPAPKRIAWLSAALPERLTQMMQYHGVGPKYARNIGMDVRDEMFENCFALDARVMKFVQYLDPVMGRLKTITQKQYEVIEKGMIVVAQQLNRSPWELDRCLYFEQDDLAKCLGLPAKSRRRKDQCK